MRPFNKTSINNIRKKNQQRTKDAGEKSNKRSKLNMCFPKMALERWIARVSLVRELDVQPAALSQNGKPNLDEILPFLSVRGKQFSYGNNDTTTKNKKNYVASGASGGRR